MTWQVYGSPVGNNHTYTLTYPVDLSSETHLQDILINGETIEGFDAAIMDYILYTDTAVIIETAKKETKQQLQITESDSLYTIVVTAEDGVSVATYTLALRPYLSHNSYLSQIYLDGTPVEGFRADSTRYVVILPTPAVKQIEPAMPVISYELAQNQASVEIETARLGESSYLTVTAEDGSQTIYDLTGIIVNGVPVERFEVGRHYYSQWASNEDIDISYTSDDKFQTVTITKQDYTNTAEYNLHVVAQDGVTEQDYKVEIFIESVPNDANLKNILLNGIELNDFERTINPKLTFDPDNNTYLVNLPAQTTSLPQVSAQLKMDGQSVDIAVNGQQVLLTVTAKDGVTEKTYTVEFTIPLSSVATLDQLFLDGEVVEGFQPDEFYYFVELPVGETRLPEVIAQKKEAAQTVAITQADVSSMRASVLVTAEDGVSKATYILCSSSA